MVRLGTLLKRTLRVATRCVAPVGLCALVLAACGSQPKQPKAATTPVASKPPARDNHMLYLYSSLPLAGPQRTESLQVQQGIRFALGHPGKKIGAYQIKYVALDDATRPRTAAKPRKSAKPHSGAAAKPTASVGWNAMKVAQNAARAARNPQTVAYVGDLDSGATELSLPVLNQAGIVQLTPGSGYPGLTDSYNAKYGITQANEPGKYYPQTNPTLLRMIPSDVVQAAAALRYLNLTGCTRFSAWAFGGDNTTTALLHAVIQTAAEYPAQYRLRYIPPPALPSAKGIGDFATYVSALSHPPGDIRCAVLVGRVTPAAGMLTTELKLQLPSGSTIVGTSGLCSPRWLHAIPKAYLKQVEPVLNCTTPALPVTAYSDGAHFKRLFESAYHHSPSAYDYYGYLAADLVVRAVRGIGRGEDPRVDVANSLSDEIVSSQPLYSFGAHGDLQNGKLQLFTTYGIDEFSGGRLKPKETVTPKYLLLSAG